MAYKDLVNGKQKRSVRS